MPLLAGLVIGYAFAWVAHVFVEHNRPATSAHVVRQRLDPVRGFRGRLRKELDRLGLR